MDYFINSFILLCLLQKCYVLGLSLDLRGSYGFIGDAVFLDCSLEGATWSSSSTRQWRVYSPATLLFDKGTPSGAASGYQEIISNANTTGKFSLEITNLTWSHIGKQFECKYVFGTASHILSSAEIEDHRNTNVHISRETVGLQIKGEITLDAIYPIPTVRAILTETKDVSADALTNRTSAASGNLTKVVIIVNYKVDNQNDYIKVYLSTPGGYSQFFTLNTAKETTTTMKPPAEGLSEEAVIGIVIGVLVFIIIIVVVFVCVCKHKKKAQQRKNKDSLGTLTQNVDESKNLQNKPT